MAKTTLPPMWWPLMDAPTVKLNRCAICGRNHPLEQHHPVRRSAGELFDANGKKRKKPTITLCGFGSNLQDADGLEYCHGLAHAHRLHFRYVDGVLEYLKTDEPMDYITALETEGWMPVETEE